MKHDISKLPKWARKLLAEQDCAIEQLRLAAERENPQGATKVAIDPNVLSDGAQHFAPDDARVRFYFDRPNGQRWINCLMVDGGLQVIGSHCYLIRPYSGNLAYVRLEQP